MNIQGASDGSNLVYYVMNTGMTQGQIPGQRILPIQFPIQHGMGYLPNNYHAASMAQHPGFSANMQVQDQKYMQGQAMNRMLYRSAQTSLVEKNGNFIASTNGE